MVRGKGAGRGARRAPKAFRTSAAVGPRPPFRCSKPQVKISYLGPSQLPRRHSPRGVRRRDRAGSFAPNRCQRHQPSAPGPRLRLLEPIITTAWTATADVCAYPPNSRPEVYAVGDFRR